MISSPSRVVAVVSVATLVVAAVLSLLAHTHGLTSWQELLFAILALASPVLLLVLTGALVWAAADLGRVVEHRTRLNIAIALLGLSVFVWGGRLAFELFTRMLCGDCVP
jgi:cadmium resistance protein CadD (predicted permease)